MVAREILKIAGNPQNIEQLIRPIRVVFLFKHKMLDIRKMRQDGEFLFLVIKPYAMLSIKKQSSNK